VKILVADDDDAVRFGIRDFMEAAGYDVEEAQSCEGTEAVFGAVRPDVAVIDYKLPDGTALDLLPKLKAIDPAVPLVILTGHGTIDLAVRAVKEGAEHFLTKPIELPALHAVLERLIESRRNWQKQLASRSRQDRGRVDPFLGPSAVIRRLAEDAQRVLASDSPILIRGETGTGKGVLAAWLHAHGRRSEEPFVDVNCAGLVRDFLETELFGHEKGAFTGAVVKKTGLLDVAHRGTAFLDEIGDMDTAVQTKVLKVLEEGQFRRMGSVQDRRVDVRLIAATHQDLARLVREQAFRCDLYYRLNTLPLTVPPLRERTEDIPVLARHLLDGLMADRGRGPLELTEPVERALAAYAWPGNIRELRNVLERSVLLSDERRISLKDLRFDASPELGTPDGANLNSAPADGPSLSTTAADGASLNLREVERRHIALVLRHEGGRVAAAAERLGVPRSSLYQKIKQYGITNSRF
jgi:DNA-binding NtrC family response regulator